MDILPRARRLRFKVEEDLFLLRTVLAENPFKDQSKWRHVQFTVTKTTGKAFTLRTIRDHVAHLMTMVRKHGADKLRK